MQSEELVPHYQADAVDKALITLGYDAFRPGQREAIETLLKDRRLLLVAPTGGGKSLCYQLPALLLDGLTLVVSPLIALMHDQVSALERRGVKATFFASTLDADEARRRMAKLRDGEYKLVYAAPERLVLEGFRTLLSESNLSLIAIDEAHCISEWGHDFRPEYMKIGELVAANPSARVLACTATATPVVRDEILGRLGLSADTPQVVRGFARPNLSLNVSDVAGIRDRERAVDDILAETLKAPRKNCGTAIIYAPTRKATEQEAQRLVGRGWRSAGYHAGMTGEDRERVQNAFIRGELDVAVATNAFGMGIDRSDVRAVIHLAPPGSIESYYQEVGRAGRDGELAKGQLLISPSDMPMRRGLLTRTGPDGHAPDPSVVEHKWSLFLELMRWAEGGSCRHDAILRYFGDEAETLSGCGRCDVCLALEQGDTHSDAQQTQLVVRKALSGIARVHGRFGLMAAVQLLRGVGDARLSRAGLDKTKTFGVLEDRPEAWVLALLRRCASAGWVDFSGQDRPVVLLTQRGAAVMRAEIAPRIILPPVALTGAPQRRKATAPKTVTHGQQIQLPEKLDEKAEAAFTRLRSVRLTLSKEAQVPPYVIASDRTLRDLAQLRPRTIAELQMAHGIGPAKAERFGHALLGALGPP